MQSNARGTATAVLTIAHRQPENEWMDDEYLMEVLEHAKQRLRSGAGWPDLTRVQRMALDASGFGR